MKKATKILTMIVCIIFITAIATNVLAVTDPSTYNGNVASGNKVSVTRIENLGNNIISVVSTVGSIASVIVLIILGIKYMMGSAEEKAEYKKTLLPYIIGAALVFAASTIAGIVFQFASGF